MNGGARLIPHPTLTNTSLTEKESEARSMTKEKPSTRKNYELSMRNSPSNSRFTVMALKLFFFFLLSTNTIAEIFIFLATMFSSAEKTQLTVFLIELSHLNWLAPHRFERN